MMSTDIDFPKLVSIINRFCAFVQYRDNKQNGYISFVDENSFLGREENYKSCIFEEAKKALNHSEWKENLIGKNELIRTKAMAAMQLSGNLVNINQKIRFMNKLDPERNEYDPLGERALFDIYKSNGSAEEAKAFAQARKVFGGFYDTLAYLFFIKDSSRFLPLSPGNFEKSLQKIGIDYKLSRNCCWENYMGFISIVQRVQEVMHDVLPYIEIRLIDAHSFLWMINESRKNDFSNWTPDAGTESYIEQNTEDCLRKTAESQSIRKDRFTSVYTRSAEVAKATRLRARGYCELCGNEAPFLDRKGCPYLETHHVIWLSRGGKDSTDNTVALCPNCHTRIHVRDDKEDLDNLLKVLQRQ